MSKTSYKISPKADKILFEFYGYEQHIIQHKIAIWLAELGLIGKLFEVDIGLKQDYNFVGSLTIVNPETFSIPKDYSLDLKNNMMMYSRRFAQRFLASYKHMDEPLFTYRIYPIPSEQKCQLVIEPNPEAPSYPYPMEKDHWRSLSEIHKRINLANHKVEIAKVTTSNIPNKSVIVEFQFTEEK